MRTLAILFSLALPGLGHLLVQPARWVASPVRGILLASAFILLVMVAVYRGFTPPAGQSAMDDWLFRWSLYGAVGVYLAAILDVLFAPRQLPQAKKEKRDRHFRQGVVYYLQNEFEDALRELKSALKVDRYDVESRLQLAMVYKAMGRKKVARRELKKCLSFDTEEKWRPEVIEELERMGTPETSSAEGGKNED